MKFHKLREFIQAHRSKVSFYLSDECEESIADGYFDIFEQRARITKRGIALLNISDVFDVQRIFEISWNADTYIFNGFFGFMKFNGIMNYLLIFIGDELLYVNDNGEPYLKSFTPGLMTYDDARSLITDKKHIWFHLNQFNYYHRTIPGEIVVEDDDDVMRIREDEFYRNINLPIRLSHNVIYFSQDECLSEHNTGFHVFLEP